MNHNYSFRSYFTLRLVTFKSTLGNENCKRHVQNVGKWNMVIPIKLWHLDLNMKTAQLYLPLRKIRYLFIWLLCYALLVLKTPFNIISVLRWWSVLLVKESGVPGEILPVYCQLRNKSWKPECVGSFNMDWRILVFYPEPVARDKIY